ncbi:hypothetical protein GCG54_00007677 [Colletotrichum gloeosporioides]|uniref:Uncharacterized protein n=1 Tax=Colletotrichum gloeosporioides TaxID=474922 RepID=A0A8H4CPW4_COLGL|nr:uncharacterized protein GCG54_00007677 [Colletotrichum gloeosporioides]KAF3807941.1 hypothetical protein GCG54_00007677 [Colletotrichum gloeosporioides]
MPDIFAQASSIYIWHSPASNNSHHFIDMAERIDSNAFRLNNMSSDSRVVRPPGDAGDDNALQLLAELLTDTSFHSSTLLKAI